MRRWWRRAARAFGAKGVGRAWMPMVLLFLAGCASREPAINPVAVPPDKAVVHVYRPASLYAVLGVPYVFVDGREQFPLAANTADALILPPGRHVLRVGGSDWGLAPGELPLAVEAGREYFVRVEPVRTTPFAKGAAVPSGYTRVEEVAPETAVGEGRPAPRRGDAAAPLAATTGGATAPATSQAVPPGTVAVARPTAPGVSAAGLAASRAIGAARVALLDGQAEVAGARLAEARQALATAASEGAVVRPGPGGTTLIPIDERLAIRERVPLTPATEGAVARANECLGRGDKRRAAAELRAAGIEVAFTRVLLPLRPTQAAVETASRLIAAGQYLEADQALKAAEDGLILEERDAGAVAPPPPTASPKS